MNRQSTNLNNVKWFWKFLRNTLSARSLPGENPLPQPPESPPKSGYTKELQDQACFYFG